MRRAFPALLALLFVVLTTAPACAQKYDGSRKRDEQFRGFTRGRDARSSTRRVRPGYQDPAYARGYADGYDKGVDDGKDRDRYDPVRHRDYRSADGGYSKNYGSKQAYENNYRSGFRQGYEAGYRYGTRRR
jgi:flagellar biosynthesis/type III secretory pathway protein FliH